MAVVRSLRGRVALLATLAVAGILIVVGSLAVASFGERERQRVDEELEARPPGRVGRALGDFAVPAPPPGAGGGVPDVRPAPPLGPQVLRERGEYVRLFADRSEVRGLGAPAGLSRPARPGLRTVEAGGVRYRSLARPGPEGTLLEVGASLEPA